MAYIRRGHELLNRSGREHVIHDMKSKKPAANMHDVKTQARVNSRNSPKNPKQGGM